MAWENEPQTPREPRTKVPRTLSPKRVSRTYTTRKRRIPFAPINTDPLAEQLHGLSLGSSARARLLRWMPRRTSSTHRSTQPEAAVQKKRITAPLAVHQLRAAPAARIPVDYVRQVRVALAAEGDAWLGAFVHHGGYHALLDRLDEVLVMEWREEQHDDQLLHELLRALVALATHPIGLGALERHVPRPFDALAALLYSRKRPADLNTRRLIVQLLRHAAALPMPLRPFPHAPSAACAAPCTPSGVLYVLALLHLEREDTERVAFLPRRTRPLRPYVAELQTLCAEFFWIFCHEENEVLEYASIDVREATKPRVPSGITGSVESEAMAYAAAHLCLLCTLMEPLLMRDPAAAAQLRHDLDEGGIYDVLDTLRKASREFYPTLHLELAHIHTLLRMAHDAPTPMPRPAAPPLDEVVPPPPAAALAAPVCLASPAGAQDTRASSEHASLACCSPHDAGSPLACGFRAPCSPASPCPAPVARVRITSITSERSAPRASPRMPSPSIPPPPSPPPEQVLGDVVWEQLRYEPCIAP